MKKEISYAVKNVFRRALEVKQDIGGEDGVERGVDDALGLDGVPAALGAEDDARDAVFVVEEELLGVAQEAERDAGVKERLVEDALDARGGDGRAVRKVGLLREEALEKRRAGGGVDVEGQTLAGGAGILAEVGLRAAEEDGCSGAGGGGGGGDGGDGAAANGDVDLGDEPVRSRQKRPGFDALVSHVLSTAPVMSCDS